MPSLRSFRILVAGILIGSSVSPLPATPPPSDGGTRSLDACSQGGRVHLLTAEGETAELYHRVTRDEGATWSAARRVDEGKTGPFSPHRGMDPQIAASGDRLIAVWTTAGTDAWGSGPLATALSRDGGLTWEAGLNPSDSGLTTGHGFIDLAADGEGVFHLVWLDSRDGRQGLRYSRSRDGGLSWSPNQTLKAGTCECCRNTLSVGPGRTLAVLFRDHDPRDMKVVVSKDAGDTWGPPFVVGRFDWKFEGCPHSGGGLAVTGTAESPQIHALVWTGREGLAGVHEATPLSQRRLGGVSAVYPDLAADSRGRRLAVWCETTEQGRVLHQTLSDGDGGVGSEILTVPGVDPTATHPLVVPCGSGFLILWTESPEGQAPRWRSCFVGDR